MSVRRVGLLVLVCLLAEGCVTEQALADTAGSQQTEGFGDGQTSGTDETTGTPMADVEGTMSAYLEVACPWSSMCSGDSLDSCLGALTEDDLAYSPGNFRALGLVERTACARAATSCAEWEACGPAGDPVFGGFEGDVDGNTCPEGVDTVCIEATNTVLGCPESGGTPFLVRDLSLDGKTCTADGVTDDPRRACQVNVCDGSTVVSCVGGFESSGDCSFVHPDFECEDFNFQCVVPTPECESNSFNNSGGSVQCQDPDTALVCMGGKSFTVSCSAVGGRCENDGDLDARCV